MDLERSAIFSECGSYRYELLRKLRRRRGKAACFVMLNPSIADAEKDDPTIRKCIGFGQRWGCVEVVVVNLFAFRATRPVDLKAAADPVGSENHYHIQSAVAHAKDGFVVLAWGTHGAWRQQDSIMLDWIRETGPAPLCLGLTKDGHPKHPLYVPYSARLIPFRRLCQRIPSRQSS